MNNLENILFDDEILKAFFSCDLEKCKGACCTFPGIWGAPVLDEEVELIENSLNSVEEYLSKKSIDYITKNGFIEGTVGNYSTVCINNKDCVFVYYDNDVAKCSFEKAYLEKRISFRKPISCHLYPIRVRRNGSISLYYDKIEECKPAIKKGLENNILLISSLKESLTRAFGEKWYNLLNNYRIYSFNKETKEIK